MQTLHRDSRGRFISTGNPTKRKRKPRPYVSGPFQTSVKPNTMVGTTHYALVLDNSSSMQGISKATVDAVNTRISALRQEAQRHNHNFSVTLITFSDNANPPTYSLVPLNNVVNLNYSDYKPNGWTALLDGVGAAIELFQKVTLGPNDAYLIEVITDGQENYSEKYWDGVHYQNSRSRNNVWGQPIHTHHKINLVDLMDSLSRQGVWTIVFQVPKGRKNALHLNYKIPLENINEWEATDIGTRESTQCTTQGFGTYTQARARGAKSVDTFYADLSKLKSSDLNKLTDLSARFKVLEVDKEEQIKEFVERKSKHPYIIGSAYYEIVSRDELIQPTKEVLIMEKGSNKIYGGHEARKLLGLPDGVSAKLSPLNLSTYRVYVQSTSVNRALVRYTKVLIDTYKFTHSQPTWGELSKQI